MPRPSTLELHDKATGGKVIPLIRERRAAGASFEAIARDLHAIGVEVSHSTVHRWWQTLDGGEAA